MDQFYPLLDCRKHSRASDWVQDTGEPLWGQENRGQKPGQQAELQDPTPDAGPDEGKWDREIQTAESSCQHWCHQEKGLFLSSANLNIGSNKGYMNNFVWSFFPGGGKESSGCAKAGQDQHRSRKTFVRRDRTQNEGNGTKTHAHSGHRRMWCASQVRALSLNLNNIHLESRESRLRTFKKVA